jgi:hypothetical protein
MLWPSLLIVQGPLRRLGFSLILVVCVMSTTAGAAKYGKECSKDTDCEEKKAPYCNIFFTDKSYDYNDL